MSTLFISYSTKDRATADIVYKQLIEMGYEQPFRDDHPNSGIPAGSDWEQELYRKLRLCKALIVICSKHWLNSKWCFAELAYAKAMGKEFFPIRIDDSNDVPSIVAERQTINLSDQNVWQRLKKGLEDAKLAPHDDFFWDISESPYPGLEPFTEKHAGVYFGRDTEIQELRETLNRMRSVGQPRLLYVVGASGSGKSSLVRAGLLPRLKTKEAGQWCLFRTFRWNDLRVSGRTWTEQLAVDLADAWPQDDLKKPEWSALRERYTISDANAATNAADRFIDDTKNLLVSLKQSNSTPLFILDQFEEVLVSTDGEPTGPFLQFIGCLMSSPRSPWRCVATVRSDFLNAIQTRPELIAWKQHTDVYSLPLMNPERFYDVIRRPAEKVGITFEPETLVDQIVKDTGDNDALPLLAFTLRELYEKYGDDKRFTYDEYANKLGRLEGCLKKVADELLTTSLGSKDSIEKQRALQLAFSSHLVGINEQDKFVRRTAVWSEIDPAAQPILRTFIARRLLTSRSSDEKNPQSEQVVEVAHEALFRKWDRLKDWLDARRDLLRWRRDVGRDHFTDGENWTGLTRSQLAIARDWPKLRREELFPQEIQWIKSAKRRVEFFWAGIVSVAMTILCVVAIAFYFRADANLKGKEVDLANRKSDFAEQKRQFAEAKEAEARTLADRRTARSLIATGDSLGNAGRWSEARSYYVRAETLLANNKLSTLPALVGLSDVFVNSPFPLAIFLGHGEPVKDVKFMPDGERAVSVSANAVIVWDLGEGCEIRRLVGHEGIVNCVAVSRDGKWVVTGGEDRSARQWDIETGKLLHSYRNHNASVLSVAISADDKRLATGTAAGALRVWNVENKTQISDFKAHSGSVLSLAFVDEIEPRFHADDNVPKNERSYTLISGGIETMSLLMGNDEGELASWNAQTGQRIRSFGGHRYAIGGNWLTGQIHSVSVSRPRSSYAGSLSSKSLLLSGSQDSTIRLWDIHTGIHLHTFVGHHEAVNAICFSRNSNMALSGGDDGTAILWNMSVRNVTRRFEAHSGRVNAVAISDDGKQALTAGEDGKVVVWNPNMHLERRLQTFHYSGSGQEGPFEATPPGAVHTVAITPDGRLGMAGCTAFDGSGKRPVDSSYNELLKIFDVRTGTELHSLRGDPETVLCSTFTPDGKLFAYGGADSRIRLHETQSGRLVFTLNGHKKEVRSIACSRNGSRLISGGGDHTVKIWSIDKGKLAYSCSGHTNEVTCVAISDDGEIGVSGSKDKSIRVWNTVNGKLLRSLAHESEVNAIALSRDSRMAVSAATDRTLKIWDLKEGKLLRTLRGHLDPIYTVVWIPDANMLASAGADNTIRIWDVETGDELRKIEYGAKYTILSLAISDDGRRLLAGSGDTQVRVLDYSRVKDYLQFEDSVTEARKKLTIDAENANANATIGKWFAFNGYDRWAVSRFELARKHGAEVANADLGAVYLRLERYEDSEREFKENSNKSDYLTDADIGLMSIKLRRRESAAKLVNEGVAALDRGEWKEALRKCSDAIEADPSLAGAYYNRGVAKHYLADDEGAIADLEKSIRLESDAGIDSLSRFSDIAHYNLACIYALQASASPEKRDLLVSTAINQLGKALGLGFNNWSTLESDADLNSLRDDDRFKQLLKRRHE